MMSSAFPLVIYKEDNKSLPEFEDVVNGLFSNNEIPIRIIEVSR